MNIVGVRRLVSTDFWLDEKVDEFSPEDKYFMLYLLTSPFTKQLGIFRISVRQIAFHLGYSIESVKVLLDRFSKKYGVILYSEKTSEVAILNYLRHSVIRGGKPVVDCIRQDMTKVKNKDLITAVFLHIRDSEDLNETIKSIVEEYLEGLSDEKLKSNIKSFIHDDNDDDNDNDSNAQRIVDESCHESCHESSGQKKQKPKEVRHRHGPYRNVMLTDAQYETLQEEFPLDYDERIERLSEYIESTGKKYKNHLAVIRTWARKDGVKPATTANKDNEEAEAFFEGLEG